MKTVSISGTVRLACMLLACGLSTSAHAQFYRDAYVEAECPNSATGNYRFRQALLPGFSGSGYLRSAATTLVAGTSLDTAVYTFKAYRTTGLKPWFRVNTNGSASDDSLFYRIDGGSWITMNNLNGTGWRWVQGSSYFVGEGNHTLEIGNREDGLNIDKFAVVFDNSATPTPTGTGNQAYNCPVPMYFESECRTQGTGEYVWDKNKKTGFSGTGYIEAINTFPDASMSTDNATYPFESGAASYYFYFRIHNNSDGWNDSWFYRIDGGAWVTIDNTSGLGSGFRWARSASSVALTRGNHTLTVRSRERRLSLDKIAFIPTTATGPSGTSAGPTAVNCEPFKTLSDLDYFEVLDYYNTHVAYFADDDILPHHLDWHAINGSGGTAGAGSGTAFMGFHRAMMNDFRWFAMGQANGRNWLPMSTTGQVIPAGLGDASSALFVSGHAGQYEPREDSSLTNYGIPAYLTVNGTANASWPATVVIDGTTYSKIGDFPNLDTLGRAIGAVYHGSLHVDVGGTMSGFYSPADPIFYAWHGLLDQLADVWLATTKGKAWAAANPNHRFLVVGFTDHHGWDNTDPP